MAKLQDWTQEELKKVIRYEPDTGRFFKVATGKEIGPGNKSRYLTIRIGDNKPYYAHRLAWLYVHGAVPDQLDHVNGIPRDNRIANLRLCSHSQNMINRERQANNRTGYRGVRLRDTGKYEAAICLNGKKYYLGSNYATALEAAEAYKKASDEVYAEFARK